MDYNRLLLKNIEFMLAEMNNYAVYMESYIQQEIADFDRDHPAAAIDPLLETDPDYYYWLIDDLSERWQEVAHIYPNNFRSALFGQIYSGFESKMVKVCELHRSRKGTAKVLSGDGSTIEKAKRYLIRQGVDFADLDKDFNFIDTIRAARNAIIHSEGIITGADKEWGKVHQLIRESNGKILFDHNPDELLDGEALYLSRPNFKFKLLFPDTEINKEFLASVDRFFKRLMAKNLF